MTHKISFAQAAIRPIALVGLLITCGVAAAGGSCFALQDDGPCGTSQTFGTIDCTYIVDGLTILLCPNTFPATIVTPGRKNKCLANQSSGMTKCDADGDSVYATAQDYECDDFGSSCEIVESGNPYNWGDPCVSAKLEGVPCSS